MKKEVKAVEKLSENEEDNQFQEMKENDVKEAFLSLSKDYTFVVDQIERCKEEISNENITSTTNNNKTLMANPAFKVFDMLMKQKLAILKSFKELTGINIKDGEEDGDESIDVFLRKYGRQ